MKNIIIIFLIVSSLSCMRQNHEMKETPIVVVIKLQSAEALMNFEEAKKYIDLEKVFKENPDSQDIEKEWKEMLTLFYNISNDKKFNNQFKYYNYEISETISSPVKAKVSFIPFNENSSTKEINYSLEKENDVWKVVDIEYIR